MRPSASRGLRPLNSFFSRRTSLINTSHTPATRLISTQTRAQPISALIPSSCLLQRQRVIPTYTVSRRHNSTQSSSNRLTDRGEGATDPEEESVKTERHLKEEAYRIVFTCTPCGNRSGHRMSKQGYHRGTVLIQCPSCQSRHIMSDHLGIFFDQGTTLEDILRNKGQTMTHGQTDGNLEFLDDGTIRKSSCVPEKDLFPSSNETSNNNSGEKPT